ncbi:MAG TPA: MFS transporter [Verrucomicrobiae bacterium]|nr:MFS transporter [Verrucomicrobiae bacterium]
MSDAAPARAAAVATGVKPTRVRFVVLAMLFVTVVINYLDRSNISVAAPSLSRDLNFDPKHLGWILSAFGWSYATLQIPGGWLVDRIRPRYLYASICALWSLATMLQGFAGTFLLLFSLRLLLGIFEAPAFPICNRLVTTWFPDRERAGAIACYTSGQYVGLAFLTPLLALTQKHLGWHYVFILTGALGLAWAALWYAFYREPSESRLMNQAEINYIRSGGGLAESSPLKSTALQRFSWADLGKTLSHRKLWGIYIGQFAVTSTMWFFLTWFPTYLVTYRHMDFIKGSFLSSLPASLPFLGAFFGILCSGLLSDFLMQRGLSASAARKTPIIFGLLLSTTIVGANFVERPALVVMFLTLSSFGNGFSSISWVMVSSLAPKRLIGLTGGVFNFFGNLPSILVPIIVGSLIHGENFKPALVYISAMALMGALSYTFVVGRVERVEEEQ